MYTHQVNFSKRFTTGILAGRLYHDYIRFTCRDDAQSFADREGQTVKACVGSDNYTIEDAMITELD